MMDKLAHALEQFSTESYKRIDATKQGGVPKELAKELLLGLQNVVFNVTSKYDDEVGWLHNELELARDANDKHKLEVDELEEENTKLQKQCNELQERLDQDLTPEQASDKAQRLFAHQKAILESMQKPQEQAGEQAEHKNEDSDEAWQEWKKREEEHLRTVFVSQRKSTEQYNAKINTLKNTILREYSKAQRHLKNQKEAEFVLKVMKKLLLQRKAK